ncbi:MAG: hypothetical protein CMO64_00345 [Verrucomicrobiales bacterium]|nr:hypothetical protein [Verrucomicrobiales bacterium]|tara:strand:+ start:98 stop:526 length:429 start_codon:yes stop_codon:yes gene_type:complete
MKPLQGGVAVVSLVIFMTGGCSGLPTLGPEKNFVNVPPANVYTQEGASKTFTGVITRNYPSGEKYCEFRYVNGLLSGPSMIFYPTGGKWWTMLYKDGVKEGRWEIFRENGYRATEIIFRNGEKVSMAQWNEDGDLVVAERFR